MGQVFKWIKLFQESLNEVEEFSYAFNFVIFF